MNARRCDDKVALVTGASGGIGGAIARVLSGEGARVALHYHRNAAAAETLAYELTAAGGQALCVSGDTTKATQCASIVEAVVRRFGKIDILVNTAGSLQNLPFGSVTAVSFDSQFHDNVLSVVLMMQAAIPYFPTDGGAVINLSTNIAAFAARRDGHLCGLQGRCERRDRRLRKGTRCALHPGQCSRAGRYGH